MRNGRTIAAEREKPMSDSERALLRSATRRRRRLRLFLVVVVGLLIAALVVRGVRSLMASGDSVGADDGLVVVKAVIVDEAETGVTTAVREFVGQMEADLAEYGYVLERVVLPVGKMREVHLYLAERGGYVKVRTDRGTGVQAEDADRMLRYLGEREFEYVDVRVEGKGYWK